MTVEPQRLWLTWIIVGTIAGLVLHLVLLGRYRLIFDVAAGAVGGLLGGLLIAVGGAVGVAHFGLLSSVMAIVGAIVALGLLRWSRLSHRQNTALRQ